MSTEVRPFHIEVPQYELDELHRRLAAARLPDQPAGAGWSDGVERSHLADLVRRWRDEFDWRAVEARLNAWPQGAPSRACWGDRAGGTGLRPPH